MQTLYVGLAFLMMVLVPILIALRGGNKQHTFASFEERDV
jgi:hypothetical protein